MNARWRLEKPYKKESLLDDVVDYVNSVKPYHVQFSHYFEHYETASELISIPKNDKLETTINYRFDAIQTTPDIVKIVENIYEEEPETLVDGIYYEEPSDTYYTIKNGKITTDFDRDSFVNSHMANRLFYMGIHNLDELKKTLSMLIDENKDPLREKRLAKLTELNLLNTPASTRILNLLREQLIKG